MRRIGYIKQLQIQRASLKAGKKPHRFYDPTPLFVVEKLYLTSNGVIGQSLDGEVITDVHNTTHPLTRNREDNDISLGFTSHYQTMRTRFGSHITDGIAGENVLVETETKQTLADLIHGLVIESQQTGQQMYLSNIIVATPCLEFSRFSAQEPQASNEQIKETLQFLNDGQRGFYAKLAAGQEESFIAVGDVLFVLDR